jgi:3-phosphoshikimate 1-carboxyvinyltransferase
VVSFPRGALRGTVDVPGDKSISHRALILQAYAREPVAIENLNPGLDVAATAAALQSLRRSPDVARGGSVVDCMNSGSTARMVLGVCAGANLRARFDGDASLRRRPMEPVAAQLRAFGARIETTDGCLPMQIDGRSDVVQTRHFILLAPSAQVKSALLFAALFAGIAIDITGDSGSRDHTERLLRYHGAQIDWNDERVAFSRAPHRIKPMSVAGDFSSAAFFLTAATLAPGSDLTISGVGINPTRTGLLDVLREMGAAIELRGERELCGEPVADLAVRYAPLHAIVVPPQLALRAIDEIPLVAIAAACAEGETRITGIADLRTKESDRVAAIARLLDAVGIETRAIPGGMAIHGGTPSPAGRVIETHGDHRIAMAAAALGAVCGEIAVDDAASAAVSFPDFETIWRRVTLPAREMPHRSA